jgi:hypothetical protein
VSTWPDAEGATRTWLRADAGVVAQMSTRVFFGVPKPTATYPLATVQRIGGGPGAGDAPVDEALLQIDVWGDKHANGNGNKAGCWTATAAVLAALEVVNDTLIATGVRAAINVESVNWLPDPADDRPRYVITVSGSFWAV